MTYLGIAILLILAIGVYLLVGPTAIPLKHFDLTPSRLRELLETSFRRGLNGAEIYICTRDDLRFMRFEKCIVKKNVVELHTSFPLTSWSAPFYEHFRSALDHRGERYVEQHSAKNGEAGALLINFGEDTDRAARIADVLFTDVFGVSIESDCYLYATKVVAWNSRVGWNS